MRKLLVLGSVFIGFISGLLAWIITKDLVKFYLNNLTSFGTLSGWAGAIASSAAACIALWVATHKGETDITVKARISINYYIKDDEPIITIEEGIAVANIGEKSDLIKSIKANGKDEMLGILLIPIGNNTVFNAYSIGVAGKTIFYNSDGIEKKKLTHFYLKNNELYNTVVGIIKKNKAISMLDFQYMLEKYIEIRKYRYEISFNKHKSISVSDFEFNISGSDNSEYLKEIASVLEESDRHF